VAHASNAAEAVSEFRRHRPDVTLMDLRLPETNGTDVLIAIRGEFPQARIIMLPTLDSEGEILRALELERRLTYSLFGIMCLRIQDPDRFSSPKRNVRPNARNLAMVS